MPRVGCHADRTRRSFVLGKHHQCVSNRGILSPNGNGETDEDTNIEHDDQSGLAAAKELRPIVSPAGSGPNADEHTSIEREDWLPQRVYYHVHFLLLNFLGMLLAYTWYARSDIQESARPASKCDHSKLPFPSAAQELRDASRRRWNKQPGKPQQSKSRSGSPPLFPVEEKKKKVTNFDEFELPELSDSNDDDLPDAATKIKSVTGDVKG